MHLAFLCTDDRVDARCAVFDQSRSARPSQLFGGMEQMRRQHHTSRLVSRLWNRQIGHLLSYACLHEGLEGREALLNRSLPLLEQCQRELG